MSPRFLVAAMLLVLPVSQARRLMPKAADPTHPPSLTWMDDEPMTGLVLADPIDDPAFVIPVAELSDHEVARVVRAHLAEVNNCYRLEARNGLIRGGKALLSLEIDGNGAVTTTSVAAPALAQSRVPACIQASAQRWSFPRSRSPKKFSCPILFVDI